MRATLTFVVALFLSAPASAITISTVPVGNAGNANDSTGFGAVPYAYNIGKYEVTVGQYTAFLNAVAATDTYQLYNSSMATDRNVAGISRSGSPDSYSYTVIGSANHPVTYVSWGDAARFANWLQNGQPTGAQNTNTTEDGAYSLNGATTTAALNAVSRNSGASWFIPSENEWYKAAYHKNDGVTEHYRGLPFSTDNVGPYSDQPPGSSSPYPAAAANFAYYNILDIGFNDGFAVTGSPFVNSNQNYLTDVGAYTFATSAYGTFDQAGNVWEWNDSATRAIRGGAWNYDWTLMTSDFRERLDPASEGVYYVGFRVAASIPEPSTLLLLCFGSLAVLWRRRALR